MINSIIEFFFSDLINEKVNQKLKQKEENDLKRENERMKENYPVGTWVITSPNEWVEVSIGPVTHYIEMNEDKGTSVVPVMYDVISGEEMVLLFSSFKTFNCVLFDIIAECDPVQRFAILTKKDGIGMNNLESMYEKHTVRESSKNMNLLSPQELRGLVYG